jgi:hypothetical protein
MLNAAMAFFLLFEISDPLWSILTKYLTAAFPWRMQVLIMCAATYLLAIKTQWLMSARQLKTWKADYTAAIGVVALFGLFMLTTRDEKQIAIFDNMVGHHMIQASVYQSQWMDKKVTTPEYIVELADNRNSKIQRVDRQGTAKAERWDGRGIAFDTALNKPGTFRLKQIYFPIWQLSIDGKPANGLMPEPHSGLILVHVPAGKHEVQLVPDVGAVMGWLYTLARIISLAAAALLAWLIRRNYWVSKPGYCV